MAKELGRKIRSIRLKRNLSQSEMADILGYSGKGMISRLENDSAEMSYEKLMLLLSRFGEDFEGETIETLVPKADSTAIKSANLVLKAIGFAELDDVLSLKVAPHQRDFVAENALAIAEAYAAEREGGKTQCFVVYHKNAPVGFVSIALGSIGTKEEKEWMKKSYCLWRIMIDMNYQGNGFGKELLTSVIGWCATKPLGEADVIYASCDGGNEGAISLYQAAGFEITGERIDGEIVLKRSLLRGYSDE
ncbi:MAG: GNAT family N-acetyltransferase [Bacilli bacterium]|nr:GNAT family N-acetyltransferase [Bacilli bacterium]